MTPQSAIIAAKLAGEALLYLTQLAAQLIQEGRNGNADEIKKAHDLVDSIASHAKESWHHFCDEVKADVSDFAGGPPVQTSSPLVVDGQVQQAAVDELHPNGSAVGDDAAIDTAVGEGMPAVNG